MNKRILIESILFSVLLMSLIIVWQVVQGYLNTQHLSSEFSSDLSSELSNEITIDADFLNQSNGTFHIAYWSSPYVLLGVDQPFGLDDLFEIIGLFILFATSYYFIRKYVSKHKITRNK